MIFFWMLIFLFVVFAIVGNSVAVAIMYSSGCIVVVLLDILKELKRINK